METLLILIVGIFSLCFLFEKVTEIIKQLKSGSAKLSNGFEARLSFVPIENKKSEECSRKANSTKNDFD